MLRSATLADVLPRQLSFKHSLQLWLAWSQRGLPPDEAQIERLLVLIGQRRVGRRPGRIEPRAVKRRPKPLPLLTQPRAIAREKYGGLAIQRGLSKCHSNLTPFLPSVF